MDIFAPKVNQINSFLMRHVATQFVYILSAHIFLKKTVGFRNRHLPMGRVPSDF